jgi:hypothetical protein
MGEYDELVDRLAQDPRGRRLIALVTDHRAEHERAEKRGPSIEGPIPGVAITCDALVDLASGRRPSRFDLDAVGSGVELARELRRRAHGDIASTRVHDTTELRSKAGADRALWIRALPPQRIGGADPLADRLLTIRAARLRFDGWLEDPGGALSSGRLELTDDDALKRRPEGLLLLARLAIRDGFTLTPETREAAVAARRSGALADARLAHLGGPLADLLVQPDFVEAFEWLYALAPEVPLADGVVIDPAALRASSEQAAGPRRVLAILRALAPDATRHRVETFAAGTRVLDGVSAYDLLGGRSSESGVGTGAEGRGRAPE